MPGMASNSPHHIGVPSCFAWYSNHVSRSLMEGLAMADSFSLLLIPHSQDHGSSPFYLGVHPETGTAHFGDQCRGAALIVGSYSVPRMGPRLVSRSGPRSTSRLGPRSTSGPGPRSTSAMVVDWWPSSTFVTVEPLKVTLEGFEQSTRLSGRCSLQGHLIGL